MHTLGFEEGSAGYYFGEWLRVIQRRENFNVSIRAFRQRENFDCLTEPGLRTILSYAMEAREAILALLKARAPDRSVCPSEVAKRLVKQDESSRAAWRDKMPEVHASIDILLDEGLVGLSWKGRPLSTRAGPYRIHRAG